MKLRAEAVILLKNGQQVAGEVVQILLIQLPHDGAVDSHIPRVFRRRAVDKNVAGMHVRMKKTVAKHLGEKDFNPALGEQFDVNLLLFKRRDVAYRHAVNSLTHHHLLAGQWPVHFWHIDKIARLEVSPQLRRVGSFTL